MDFMAKMDEMAASIKKVRESLKVVDPRTTQIDPNWGISDGERLVNGRQRDRHFEARVAKLADVYSGVLKGTYPMYYMKEAMTTSDFPNLFGDLLYRQLLGNYIPYPVTYPQYMRIEKLRDFRKLHMYAIDGGQGILTVVKEREPYPEIKFIETPYTVAVQKYGRRYGISFEMGVNDDLNAFAKRPGMMAVGARRSEEWLATGLLCNSAGPHSSFYTSGNKNIVTGNPILSIQGLQTAWTVLGSQLDADGQPIIVEGVTLVVPPALRITAENIAHALQIKVLSSGGNPTGAASGGGTPDQQIYAENWMKGKVTIAVNPYLPYINTTSGNTSWYLVANPADETQRPAFVFAKMLGREDPQLFVKDPDSRMLGGGTSDPMEGNFDSDSIDYKLRHIIGAAQIDPKMTVASNGTES